MTQPCPRCDKEFPEEQLKGQPWWLRPGALVFALKTRAVLRESSARYCASCRRSVNAALLFLVPCIIGVTLAVLLSGNV